MAGAAYDEILAAVADVFGRPATPDDDVLSMGGTSLHIVELVARLEDIVSRPVDLVDLINASTIHGFAATLARETVEQPSAGGGAG